MSEKTTAALARLRATYDEQRRLLREIERAELAVEKLPARLRHDPPTVWPDGFSAGYNEALAILREAIA